MALAKKSMSYRYANLSRLIDRSRGGEVKVGSNVAIYRDGASAIAVRLHATVVAKIYPDHADGTPEIMVDNHGWSSVTTMRQISDILHDHGISGGASSRGGWGHVVINQPEGKQRSLEFPVRIMGGEVFSSL